jgi:hypothetical protein
MEFLSLWSQAATESERDREREKPGRKFQLISIATYLNRSLIDHQSSSLQMRCGRIVVYEYAKEERLRTKTNFNQNEHSRAFLFILTLNFALHTSPSFIMDLSVSFLCTCNLNETRRMQKIINREKNASRTHSDIAQNSFDWTLQWWNVVINN